MKKHVEPFESFSGSAGRTGQLWAVIEPNDGVMYGLYDTKKEAEDATREIAELAMRSMYDNEAEFGTGFEDWMKEEGYSIGDAEQELVISKVERGSSESNAGFFDLARAARQTALPPYQKRRDMVRRLILDAYLDPFASDLPLFKTMEDAERFFKGEDETIAKIRRMQKGKQAFGM